MRKLLIGFAALLITGAMTIPESDAARVGSARSSGAQRSIAKTPPAATPAKPAQQAAPAQGQTPPAQPAPSGFAKWAPLLGGLAIGGLLGSMFGGNLGGFGGILLMALLAIGAVFVIKAFMRRREQPQTMQYAGFNEKFGEKVTMPSQAAPASDPVSAPANIPAGFDTVSFLRGAKLNFVKLQVANDAANLDEIREFTTPEMYEELSKDVRERGAAQQTDVIQLNADLLEVATEQSGHWASVRFSGLMREAPGAAPAAFEEVWNLAKPADGSSGWLLAGIQQTQ